MWDEEIQSNSIPGEYFFLEPLLKFCSFTCSLSYLATSQQHFLIFKMLREKVQIMKQSSITGANVKGLMSLQRIKMCTTPEVVLFQCFSPSGIELLRSPTQVDSLCLCSLCGCFSCSTTTDDRLYKSVVRNGPCLKALAI